ncbi:MAG: hypothetical protein U1D30_23080, partial [Planctomycetota bacterium]
WNGGGYWNNCSIGSGGWGFGIGYVLGSLLSQNWYGGYGIGGYGYSWPYYTYSSSTAYPVYVDSSLPLTAADAVLVPPVDAPEVAPTVDVTDQPDEIAAGDFAASGEEAFKASNYPAATRAWRHALLDEPENGTLVLMLSQSLFADGKFDEAAGALQQALSMLPKDQWGVVVKNYKQLYGQNGDYAAQIRALEKARSENPKSPALRFLLGYHYGFLNYPGNAVEELKEAAALAPQDSLAKQLLDMFSKKN